MSSATLRLFVAVYPDAETAASLLAAAAELDLPPRRWMPPEQVHVTLQFIGERPVRDLDDTIESVGRSAAGLSRFSLRPLRILSLPRRGPSRLIAAETTTAPALAELKKRLVTRLANPPKPAGRPFLPHLTLARFRAPAAGVTVEHVLLEDESLAFDVGEIRLMRSVLRPDGAVHEPVETFTLSP